MSDALSRFLESRQLVLHLGAHKTATTYIQSALAEQREALRTRGTEILLPVDLRRDDTADHPGKTQKLAEMLDQMAGDPAIRRIVISEENLIGSTGNNLTRRSLYPGLRRRLEQLPAAIDHPNVQVHFALRDYGTYLSSGLTTAVRRGRVFDHDALRTGFLPLRRNWVDVITDLHATMPCTQLKIWRYEDFAALQPTVLSEIAEEVSSPPQKRAFRTLSGAAMQRVMQQLEQNTLPEEARKIARKAARQHPISDETPAFTLWSSEEARELSNAYDRHWQEICAAYPGSTLHAT